MVNVVIWEFLPPRSFEEKEFAIAYFRQFHYFQGFRDVFIPQSVFLSVSSVVESEDSYIKTMPMMTEKETRVVEDLEKLLDSLLWKMKKTDVLESGLTSLLAAFAVWLQSRSLSAVVVLPLSDPTGYCSKLVHLLAGDQRDYIGCLAEDVELWFFSHFADFSTEWPYFLNFALSRANKLEKDSCFLRHRKQLVWFRKNYLLRDVTRIDFTEYERALSIMARDQKTLLQYASVEYHEHIVVRKASLAPSTENLKVRTNLRWKCGSFGKMLKDAEMHNGVFSPYFLNFDFYPSELLRSIEPADLLNNDAVPLLRASLSFETGLKAELELALDNYGKRIRV